MSAEHPTESPPRGRAPFVLWIFTWSIAAGVLASGLWSAEVSSVFPLIEIGLVRFLLTGIWFVGMMVVLMFELRHGPFPPWYLDELPTYLVTLAQMVTVTGGWMATELA